MLECKFCPFTKMEELNGGEFAAWSNPLATNGSPGDMKKAMYGSDTRGGHLNGTRGWHSFWYAVSEMYQAVEVEEGTDGKSRMESIKAFTHAEEHTYNYQQMMNFRHNAPDYQKCRAMFDKVGLLKVPTGNALLEPTADQKRKNGIWDKFRKADTVMELVECWLLDVQVKAKKQKA